MNSNEIFEKLQNIIIQDSDYLVFYVENSNCYFGKDRDNCIVYMIKSNSDNTSTIYQETNSLKFAVNKRCVFSFEDEIKSEVMHLLICKEKSIDNILAFIHLTRAFSINDVHIDQYYFAKLFSSISALFDKKNNISEMELQGLYAELYTILYLKKFDCDISHYWQSKGKMKFDFSLTSVKRIDIKSTLKQSRTHHFKHDQLLSELYDIKIVSVLLQKNDRGLSLNDLITTIIYEYSDFYSLILHIESIKSQIDNSTLDSIKFDEVHIDENIRFYDAKSIPHFEEKSPQGIYNAEYDCILDTIQPLSIDDIRTWIHETDKENGYV